MSIVELLVSLTLFSLIVGSLVTLIATGLSVARNNKNRSVAAHLASQEMDRLRELPFGSITIGQTTRTTSVSSVRYTIRTDTGWVANSATTNACDSASGSPRVLRATVTVTWTDMRGTEPVHTSTEITPPVGSYDPLNGHIAVRIRDRGATPLGGVPVRVVGPGVDRTQTSLDESGCAFFGFLPPGSYTVTLGTPGWVDRQSNATPGQTVGVTAETVSSVAFDYDRAATVTATLRGVNGGTPTADAAVVLANTSFLPNGVKEYPGAGVLRTIPNLFPFTAGVQAWAGSCADADPEGVDPSGTRYWPGAQRDPAINLDPGGTTSADVPMGTVQVRFQKHSGLGLGQLRTLVAEHAPDSSCPSGESRTIGVTGADSTTLLVAVPYGTWTFRTATGGPNSSWETVAVDPRDNGITDVDVEAA